MFLVVIGAIMLIVALASRFFLPAKLGFLKWVGGGLGALLVIFGLLGFIVRPCQHNVTRLDKAGPIINVTIGIVVTRQPMR